MTEPTRIERFEIPEGPEFEAELASARAAGPGGLTDFFAGCLTHLYPSHEDTMRFLDEEHASWEEFDRRLDDD